MDACIYVDFGWPLHTNLLQRDQPVITIKMLLSLFEMMALLVFHTTVFYSGIEERSKVRFSLQLFNDSVYNTYINVDERFLLSPLWAT